MYGGALSILDFAKSGKSKRSLHKYQEFLSTLIFSISMKLNT